MLSDRERQVLQLAAGGATNKEIALALGISPQTVKNHFYSIGRCYRTSGKIQAIILGIANGEIDLNIAINEAKSRLN